MMNQLKYINQDTLSNIENYLSIKEPPSIVLAGISGLGKTKAAYFIAASLLCCDENDLINNADFFETKRKKALKVEDIEEILYLSQRSSIGDRKVFIIHNADTVTKITQNRFLKLIEDFGNKNILIFISNNLTIIPTIISRCYFIKFHPLKQSLMESVLKEFNIEDCYHDFISFLLENAPYHLIDDTDFLDQYIEMHNKLKEIKKKEDLLPTLHVLAEKDSFSFYDNHSDHISWTIRLILFPFYKMLNEPQNNEFSTKTEYPYSLYTKNEAFQILETGLKHLNMAHCSYTKNEFFNLLRYIVQIL